LTDCRQPVEQQRGLQHQREGCQQEALAIEGHTQALAVNGKGTVWWNARSRQCVQMITADGRADSVTDIGSHPRCR